MPMTDFNAAEHLMKRCRQFVAGTSLALLCALPGMAAAQNAADETEEREIKPCIECHEAFYGIMDSKHFVKGDKRTPGGNGDECTACHGDTTAHNKAPRSKARLPNRFGNKFAAAAQNEKCLACHQTGTRIHWQGSGHDRAQVACASCHKMHVAKDPVMVEETQAGVCSECHKDHRANMMKMSNHPVKTGFFACSSCHQSHGSTTRALLAKDTVNDTCYQCHADKRGPFLWEHRPAVDDCTNCHNPHGTNNAPMLKSRLPHLCQNCHQDANHSNSTLDGADLTGGNGRYMLGRQCANCHSKVHGTNHPSGARLQR